ncbi:MAG TPA: serine hydrolase, partial [Holophaga sp.]|nr:serine hydrolase [Holophaga sp.]
MEALRGEARLSHRAGARFAYCSTFKWLLAAAVLEAADAGRLRLDEAVAVRKEDLLLHSPVTEARVGKAPMTLAELCEATVTTSDNAAAHLLEGRIGGLAAMRAFAGRLGDATTRFDRLEPDLNENRSGDPRDTTSPAAMARNLKRVLETDILTPASR